MAMKIHARRCTVEELPLEEAHAFMDLHHRSGRASQASHVYSLGLLHEGELVGVMQFCSPRTSAMQRRYTTELLRLAFPAGVRVRGGASKLFREYLRRKDPSDVFTYQDTTGEASRVYEDCGFTLVGQAKRKRYLVAPGKTIATGTRREVLGLPYAVRYGPDRILGTSLGEVLREDGGRKSNLSIFLENLGWHLEETSGDRLYEWRAPAITFYTYKTTAVGSDKYYYGVSHVKKAHATEEDCLAHPYYGSGDPKGANNKFVNWKRRHASELRKEIVALHPHRQAAYAHEALLVGDSWRTDPLCLNSAPGGGGYVHKAASQTMRTCPLHGETLHQGRRCRRCVAAATTTQEVCEVHGLTSFWGGSCSRCKSLEKVHLATCEVHGETKHKGTVCYKCEQSALVQERNCPVHGRVLHQGSFCTICKRERDVSLEECPKHGRVKHQFGKCYRCSSEKRTGDGVCPKHGLTKFYASTCAKCAAEKAYGEGECPRHGCVKLRGSTCVRCSAEVTAHKRFHGEKAKEGCPLCSS